MESAVVVIGSIEGAETDVHSATSYIEELLKRWMATNEHDLQVCLSVVLYYCILPFNLVSSLIAHRVLYISYYACYFWRKTIIMHPVRPSVRPSIPCLWLSRNLAGIALHKLTVEANLRSKGQGHWERKCENRFLLTYPSKVDRFTSNRDQNDHRPILHRRIHFTGANASFLLPGRAACRSGHLAVHLLVFYEFYSCDDIIVTCCQNECMRMCDKHAFMNAARDIDMAIPFVCPSVCHTLVLCLNG